MKYESIELPPKLLPPSLPLPSRGEGKVVKKGALKYPRKGERFYD
jgi:hypothetical protein